MGEPLLSRRLVRLIRDGHSPALNPQTNRFPDVATLREEVTRLRAEGMAKEAHLLGRTIRDILLLTSLSTRMSKSMRLGPATLPAPARVRHAARLSPCRG